MTKKKEPELLYSWRQEIVEKRKLQRVTYYWLVLAGCIEEALAFVKRQHSRRQGQDSGMWYLPPAYHCTVSEHRIADRAEAVVIISQYGSIKLREHGFAKD